jgi:hypothetical protein
MNDAIERLLERLQTGWRPPAGEIDRDVPQIAAIDWEWSHDGRSILSRSADQRPQIHGDILYVDQHLNFALTTEAMLWLIDTSTIDEIIDDDVWILQRDADESDEDYAARAKMLGCDAEGRIRLRCRDPDGDDT